MATYSELYGLLSTEAFEGRVRFALYVAANLLYSRAQATAEDKALARRIFEDGLQTKWKHIMVQVVSNAAVVSAGAAVTDSALQTIMNDIVKDLR